MTAAERLKELIDARGVTYSFLASKTGIPVASISKALLGKRRLPADELVEICKVINIDLNDFRCVTLSRVGETSLNT